MKNVEDVDRGQSYQGTIQLGSLPAGEYEQAPVTIIRAEAPGDTVVVTSGLHGNETTAVAVAHELTRFLQPENLKSGTVVIMPILNPAGLRHRTRYSSYQKHDPNRQFPEYVEPDAQSEAKNTIENHQALTNRRIFKYIRQTDPSLVLDLHTTQETLAMPHVIYDRIRYGNQRERQDAVRLHQANYEEAQTLGLPYVCEYPPEVVAAGQLHRTLTSSVLNTLETPALTLELGGARAVRHETLEEGVDALRRSLNYHDILDRTPDPAPSFHAYSETFSKARLDIAKAPNTGLIHHHLEPGDYIENGTPLYDYVTTHGNIKRTITSDQHGFVLRLLDGMSVYRGDPLLRLAVEDEGAAVFDARDYPAFPE